MGKGPKEFLRPWIPWGENLQFSAGGSKAKAGVAPRQSAGVAPRQSAGVSSALVDRSNEYLMGNPRRSCSKYHCTNVWQHYGQSDPELLRSDPMDSIMVTEHPQIQPGEAPRRDDVLTELVKESPTQRIARQAPKSGANSTKCGIYQVWIHKSADSAHHSEGPQHSDGLDVTTNRYDGCEHTSECSSDDARGDEIDDSPSLKLSMSLPLDEFSVASRNQTDMRLHGGSATRSQSYTSSNRPNECRDRQWTSRVTTACDEDLHEPIIVNSFVVSKQGEVWMQLQELKELYLKKPTREDCVRDGYTLIPL